MKKVFLVFLIIFVTISFSGCNDGSDILQEQPMILKAGDLFTVSGLVQYSDEPSDIGNEYCYITGEIDFEYYYDDIYDEESKWSSKIFYTKGNDTLLLKDYIGQEIKVLGAFDSESHGVPYITNISIISDKK